MPGLTSPGEPYTFLGECRERFLKISPQVSFRYIRHQTLSGNEYDFLGYVRGTRENFEDDDEHEAANEPTHH